MPQFIKHKLSSLCSKIGSGSTPRGGDAVYKSEGISLIRSQNILDFTFSTNGLAFIDEKQAKELGNVALKERDVLLNITGDSVARVSQVPDSILPARVNQHVAIIRADQQKLNPEFLKYSLLSRSNKEMLLSLASTGATRKAITKAMIEDFEIEIPDEEGTTNQTLIASILSSIDDKIELNRRTNQTLEQIARTLFKKYFVGDMDPENLPGGWELSSLDKIADYVNGIALQKFRPKDESNYLPVVKIKEMKNGISHSTEKASTEIPKQYIIVDGDILFSWSGSLEVEIWCNGNGALNQHLFKVSSKVYPKWFYYYWTKQHLQDFKNTAASKATTMGHIQRHHLAEAKVLIPPADLLNNLNNLIEPLLNRIILDRIENRNLEKIRDLLLPKLMSGEIEVNAIENELAEA